MSDDVTKLDQLDKSDPALQEKTSELIARRAEEEKRKADLRKEMTMAKARAEAKAKKGVATESLGVEVQPQQPQPQVASEVPSLSTEAASKPDEYITVKKFQETILNINRSFSWLENYVKEQNGFNAKVDKLVNSITKAVEEYNKK